MQRQRPQAIGGQNRQPQQKINAASQRQRRFTRCTTRIYGVTVSGPLAVPVARHCGTYIDSTCGCGTW